MRLKQSVRINKNNRAGGFTNVFICRGRKF